MRTGTRDLRARARAIPGLLTLVLLAVGCAGEAASPPPVFAYDNPVLATSPWPMFRRTTRNNGRSPVLPVPSGRAPWSFHTGKGMFHAPVIGGDGTVYMGSADTNFYAIGADGKEKWRFPTGEMIDSSALLGNDGTIYVPAGDGNLYALDSNGVEKWRRPSPGASGFITWWEGHVTMGADGNLYLGNDDFHLYQVGRDGTIHWGYRTGDQVWSCPGFGPDGAVYAGSNDMSLRALDASGNKTAEWGTLGPVTSSPAVSDDGRLVVVGSFDGYVHGIDPTKPDAEAWSFATRDHIYGSAAIATDGTVYIGSADGTLYALNPDGTQKWAFDTLDPIRSSPAIDGEGNVYFGAGDGRLYCLAPDGTRRWSYDTSQTDRNDLNGSPALGLDGVVIGGEAGTIFFVPYDFCPSHADDPRCVVAPGEDIPADGTFLYRFSAGGDSVLDSTEAVGPLDALVFRLMVRQGGDTVAARVDPERVVVTATPEFPHRVGVSADGRFVEVVPTGPMQDGTTYVLEVSGTYLVGGDRFGNKVSGGEDGGTFARSVTISTRPAATGASPFQPPSDTATILRLTRLAVPQPPLMTTFNQIGFASYNYLVGLVDADPVSGKFLALAAEGTPGLDPQIRMDTRTVFVLNGASQGRSYTMESRGFELLFGALSIVMDRFRVAGRLDDTGRDDRLNLYAEVDCGDVGFYGAALDLLGMCNAATGLLVANGTAVLSPHPGPGGTRIAGLTATVTHTPGAGGMGGTVEAIFAGTAVPSIGHLPVVVLVDPATGDAVECRYGANTQRAVAGDGRLTGVVLTVPDDIDARGKDAIVTVDLFPLARVRLP
jgi:outer membrane protein assembly factor BamB